MYAYWLYWLWYAAYSFPEKSKKMHPPRQRNQPHRTKPPSHSRTSPIDPDRFIWEPSFLFLFFFVRVNPLLEREIDGFYSLSDVGRESINRLGEPTTGRNPEQFISLCLLFICEKNSIFVAFSVACDFFYYYNYFSLQLFFFVLEGERESNEAVSEMLKGDCGRAIKSFGFLYIS